MVCQNCNSSFKHLGKQLCYEFLLLLFYTLIIHLSCFAIKRKVIFLDTYKNKMSRAHLWVRQGYIQCRYTLMWQTNSKCQTDVTSNTDRAGYGEVVQFVILSHFTNHSWAHWNIVQNFSSSSSKFFPLRLIIMILPGHNFAHVKTAELSWHVQNCGLIGWLFFMQQQHLYLWDLDCELTNCL